MIGQVSDLTMRNSATRVAGSLSATHQTAARPALKLPMSSAATGTTTSTTTGTSSPSDSSGTITSSDFLTLLVTEMKNQDPTQPTDPNAYIQQLVGVNSLQQLIGINQELGTALGTSSSTSSAASGSSVTAIQPASNS
jgi:flagellar basal-body rod modification protein FlgD